MGSDPYNVHCGREANENVTNTGLTLLTVELRNCATYLNICRCISSIGCTIGENVTQ